MSKIKFAVVGCGHIGKRHARMIAENDKFENKGNKAAGTRARKALAEFTKAAKERRKEIQDSKTAEQTT
jgi:predicted dehydrogenase